ncbi:MAG: phosphate transport system permease protein, partial [Kiritimatiellia bacterium]
TEQISGMPEAMKFGTAAVLIGLILVVNSFSIGLRIWLRSRKKW